MGGWLDQVELRLAKPASRAGAGAWLGLAWQYILSEDGNVLFYSVVGAVQ